MARPGQISAAVAASRSASMTTQGSSGVSPLPDARSEPVGHWSQCQPWRIAFAYAAVRLPGPDVMNVVGDAHDVAGVPPDTGFVAEFQGAGAPVGAADPPGHFQRHDFGGVDALPAPCPPVARSGVAPDAGTGVAVAGKSFPPRQRSQKANLASARRKTHQMRGCGMARDINSLREMSARQSGFACTGDSEKTIWD